MCDTILATPGSTASRTMLFGKNSDRQRNEAQCVEYFPATTHQSGDTLRCTYISIPQASRTFAVLISRPFWMWGAEMGANEHGVTIGNEGLNAREPAPETPALLGMDLLRLALERAMTAAEAVDVIRTLLERHGQGGNCGHLLPAYYNNGFMIADAREAFVMETVGKEWLVERVRGVRSMSNTYSIERQPEARSEGLLKLVREAGWSSEPNPDYAAVIASRDSQHIGSADARRACSSKLLTARDGRLHVGDMISILRDHGPGDSYRPEWREEYADKRTLCLHASANERSGQTVGSMVSELRERAAIHWVTGTSAPCLSIFKPILMDADLPAHGPTPSDRFDASTLWWRHERLHRAAVLGDFAGTIERIRPERDALEADFRERIEAVLNGGTRADRSHVVATCWRDAMAAEDRWYAQVDHSVSLSNEALVASWRRLNQIAHMDPDQGRC